MFCDCSSIVNSLLCALVLRSWFKFYLVLFLAMVIYESGFETQRLKFKQRIEVGHRIYLKIPKISPGVYIFQRPFLRGLYLEGRIYGGKFSFQNRLG